MPELPEIETIKRVIEPQIQELMIDKVNVKRGEMLCRIVVGGRGSVYCPACQKDFEV